MTVDLTDDELTTYSRQIALEVIDYSGQARLRQARVGIVGLGGLGSSLAMMLTAMGVGHLRLIDRDVVCRSDLHRQLIYDRDMEGLAKVEAAAMRLSRMNPEVELVPRPQWLRAGNAQDLLAGLDLVLDGLDSPETRYLLNRVCQRLGLPWIFGAAIQTTGNLLTVLPGQSPCLECFMPGLRNRDLPQCGMVGVHPSVLGVVTSLQVSEAVSLLTGGEPQLVGRLLHVELMDMSFNHILLRRREDCPGCGPAVIQQPAAALKAVSEESCSRDGRRCLLAAPARALELDMTELAAGLQRAGYAMLKQGRWGLTCQGRRGEGVSVLGSGVMIVQTTDQGLVGPEHPGAAVCREIMTGMMGLAPADLPEFPRL